MLTLFVVRFISHNPLDCDHATTYTLKYVLKETAGLKSFDGHKIKCQGRVPLMPKNEHGKLKPRNPNVGIENLREMYKRSLLSKSRKLSTV